VSCRSDEPNNFRVRLKKFQNVLAFLILKERFYLIKEKLFFKAVFLNLDFAMFLVNTFVFRKISEGWDR